MSAPRFEALHEAFTWRPIRGCPGRFRLSHPAPLSFVQILGMDGLARRCVVSATRDPVWVASLEDGAGLISYEQPDGRLVHTLNTPEGFQRKLAQLGIPS